MTSGFEQCHYTELSCPQMPQAERSVGVLGGEMWLKEPVLANKPAAAASACPGGTCCEIASEN